MSWLEGLKTMVGVGTNPIKDTFDGLNNLFTSDKERGALEIVRLKLINLPAEQQHELNKLNATNRSLFIAGWRPAIGWICVIALAITYVVNPILATYFNTPVQGMPEQHITELVYALLGLGALRTYEKQTGTSR